MKKIYLAIPLMVVLVITAFAMMVIPSVAPEVTTTGVGYNSEVCVYKNGEQVGDCTSNTLYNAGKEMIEDLLVNPSASGDVLTIALCNAGDTVCQIPVAAATETFSAFDGGDGCDLTNDTGTYFDLVATNGNWSVQKTFISNADGCETNATRLQNATSDLFAGNSFTHVTLNQYDQLTINWTIWVSEG